MNVFVKKGFEQNAMRNFYLFHKTIVQKFHSCVKEEISSFFLVPPRHCAIVLKAQNDLVSGGKSGENLALSTVEKYDPLTRQWVRILPMPSAREYVAVAVCDEEVSTVHL